MTRAAPERTLAAWRAAATWLAFVGLTALGHESAAAYLARRDVVALLIGHDVAVVAAAGLLAIARGLLFFVAPAWALHLALRAALHRRAS